MKSTHLCSRLFRGLAFALAGGMLSLALFPGIVSAEDSVPTPEPKLGKAGESLLSETFDGETLGDGWGVQFGDWKVVEGVLRARQVKADNHGAAARRKAPLQDAIIQLRFRLVEKGQAFHFGFDPAPGELDKKGHLWSVMIFPNKWQILKHVDKAKPDQDPNETLAVAEHEFEYGRWYTLVAEAKGDEVLVQIPGVGELKATHPTFHVKKPTLVFRCIGDGVEVDDIQVLSYQK